ncbi:MAG: hypothetical protein ACO25F_10640 [Erythrobacter sp.]
MIGAAFLLTLQVLETIQMPAPPISEAIPATGFSCDLLDAQGNRFTLRGTFPEAPAGWDPNRAMPMTMEGDGRPELIGARQVKPFGAGADYRRYYVTAEQGASGHFNLLFVLLDGETSLVTVDRFTRNPETGGGTMTAFATGDCEADFDVKAAQ